MKLEDLEHRVMSRLNLTSADQRARVRMELNDRYREVQSSLNLGRTRRASKTFTTVSGTATVVASGVSLLETLYDTTILKRPLEEVPLSWIRERDAAASVTGTPEVYAVQSHTNDVLTLRLYPKPDAVQVLSADVLATGTDMTEADDEPSFPSDFHDILVHGALADEYMKIEKARPLAEAEERKFEKRLSELRLHIARGQWLSRQTTDNMSRSLGTTARGYPGTLV